MQVNSVYKSWWNPARNCKLLRAGALALFRRTEVITFPNTNPY